jgi:hypothetical protein
MYAMALLILFSPSLICCVSMGLLIFFICSDPKKNIYYFLLIFSVQFFVIEVALQLFTDKLSMLAEDDIGRAILREMSARLDFFGSGIGFGIGLVMVGVTKLRKQPK